MLSSFLIFWEEREMRKSQIEIPQVKLLCFYTKKGDETTSPYEAQLWREKAIPVYVRIQNSAGTIIESLVRRIHFKYQHNASVTLKVKKSTQKFDLVNAFCDTRVLYYNELHFFYDRSDIPLTTKQAYEHIFSSIDEVQDTPKKKKKNTDGRIISILYVDNAYYSGTTTGIIHNVLEYHSESQIVVTKAQKIFLLKKQ